MGVSTTNHVKHKSNKHGKCHTNHETIKHDSLKQKHESPNKNRKIINII